MCIYKPQAQLITIRFPIHNLKYMPHKLVLYSNPRALWVMKDKKIHLLDEICFGSQTELGDELENRSYSITLPLEKIRWYRYITKRVDQRVMTDVIYDDQAKPDFSHWSSDTNFATISVSKKHSCPVVPSAPLFDDTNL